jgi:hypothetical protein
MWHIYGLKYPYYDVNKNKIEKTLLVLFGLNGRACLHTKKDRTGTIGPICTKMITSVMKSG